MAKLFLIFFLTLSFQYSFSQNDTEEEVEYKYAEGYYVDNSGFRFDGEIFIGSNRIFFYAKNSEKKEKIKLEKIDTLVLNEKRFLVLKEFELNAEISFHGNYFENLIVEEILNGKIKLYRTNAEAGLNVSEPLFKRPSFTYQPKQASYDEEFYIVQKGKSEFIQVKTGNKKFRRLITNLTNDNPEALKEINIKEKDYYSLIDIIKLYNSKYK